MELALHEALTQLVKIEASVAFRLENLGLFLADMVLDFSLQHANLDVVGHVVGGGVEDALEGFGRGGVLSICLLDHRLVAHGGAQRRLEDFLLGLCVRQQHINCRTMHGFSLSSLAASYSPNRVSISICCDQTTRRVSEWSA